MKEERRKRIRTSTHFIIKHIIFFTYKSDTYKCENIINHSINFPYFKAN